MKTKIKIFFEILFHKEINDINNIHMDKARPCSNITLFMDKRDNGTFLKEEELYSEGEENSKNLYITGDINMGYNHNYNYNYIGNKQNQ